MSEAVVVAAADPASPASPSTSIQACWMWGEAPSINVFKWSKTRGMTETIQDLQAQTCDGSPLILSITHPGKPAATIKCANVEVAIEELRQHGHPEEAGKLFRDHEHELRTLGGTYKDDVEYFQGWTMQSVPSGGLQPKSPLSAMYKSTVASPDVAPIAAPVEPVAASPKTPQNVQAKYVLPKSAPTVSGSAPKSTKPYHRLGYIKREMEKHAQIAEFLSSSIVNHLFVEQRSGQELIVGANVDFIKPNPSSGVPLITKEADPANSWMDVFVISHVDPKWACVMSNSSTVTEAFKTIQPATGSHLPVHGLVKGTQKDLADIADMTKFNPVRNAMEVMRPWGEYDTQLRLTEFCTAPLAETDAHGKPRNYIRCKNESAIDGTRQILDLDSLHRACIGNLLIANNDSHMGNMNLLADPAMADSLQVHSYDFGAAFNADRDENGFTTMGNKKTAREMVDRYTRPNRGTKASEGFNQFALCYPKSWTLGHKAFWEKFETVDENRVRTAVRDAMAKLQEYFTPEELDEFLADRLFNTTLGFVDHRLIGGHVGRFAGSVFAKFGGGGTPTEEAAVERSDTSEESELKRIYFNERWVAFKAASDASKRPFEWHIEEFILERLRFFKEDAKDRIKEIDETGSTSSSSDAAGGCAGAAC